MRARYYEPSSGRFSSEDPSRSGANLYLYANSNPEDFVDGSGKDFISPGEWVAWISQMEFSASRSAEAKVIITAALISMVAWVDVDFNVEGFALPGEDFEKAAFLNSALSIVAATQPELLGVSVEDKATAVTTGYATSLEVALWVYCDIPPEEGPFVNE